MSVTRASSSTLGTGAHLNLLTRQQSSAETDASGWTVDNGTLDQSEVWSRWGESSFRMTAADANPVTMTLEMPIPRWDLYDLGSFVAKMYVPGTGGTVALSVAWLLDSEVQWAEGSGLRFASPEAGLCVPFFLPFPEEADAVRLEIYFDPAAAGATCHVDAIGFWQGFGGTWAPGGEEVVDQGLFFPGDNTFIMYDWDTWQPVQFAPIPEGGALGEVLTKASADDFDFEWAAGASDPIGPNLITGSETWTIDGTLDTISEPGYWLITPTDPESQAGMSVILTNIDPGSFTYTFRATVYTPWLLTASWHDTGPNSSMQGIYELYNAGGPGGWAGTSWNATEYGIGISIRAANPGEVLWVVPSISVRAGRAPAQDWMLGLWGYGETPVPGWGEPGQVLTKMSAASGDRKWAFPAVAPPDGALWTGVSWRFGQDPPPLTGELQSDGGGNFDNATEIYISETDSAAVDRSALLAQVQPGDRMILASSQFYGDWVIGTVADSGDYRTFTFASTTVTKGYHPDDLELCQIYVVPSTYPPGGPGMKLTFVMEGSAPITAGVKKAYVTCPRAGTVSRWRVTSDVSTTCEVKVLRSTLATYPTFAEVSGSSARPSLTADAIEESTSLTGWTTSIAAGDVLDVEVVSNTAATKMIVDLWLTE